MKQLAITLPGLRSETIFKISTQCSGGSKPGNMANSTNWIDRALQAENQEDLSETTGMEHIGVTEGCVK